MKLFLFLLLLSLCYVYPDYEKSSVRDIMASQDSTKITAFTVLTNKCNVCHATKKKQDVFTLENMDSLASDINIQVFIKKKMPKGRKIKLTDEEQAALRAWLDVSLK
ncbi:MAG: hypothetical protein AB8B59_18715 [Maribacter sp.]